MTSGEKCRRRQILDHFGDVQAGAPNGRCCDVCDPDPELERVMQALVVKVRSERVQSGGEPVDEGQFEKLKEWRYERAEGKPAFVVATNAVLEEVLRRRPRSVDELIEISGIGQTFCEKHGESLLEALDTLEGATVGGAQY
jgi:superfamily II DNA helicase RecQ